jgi:hypothetical protein
MEVLYIKMTYNNINSVLFPIFASFPNVLSFGSSNEPKKNITGKKVLVYLDVTGSMGEYANETGEYSKLVLAKNLLEKVLIVNGYDYEIVPFNTQPHEVCKLEGVPMPGGSTYFTPLVPDATMRLTKGSGYCAVLFVSDGLPTEDRIIAHDAIKTIGNITREVGANPVSVAIGSDADGQACALFAGNRGYNCFIKYEKDIDQIAKDICNGIECNYHMLPNGSFIPIEADSKYYYVGTNVEGDSIKPNRKLVEKYLNLVIHKHMADVSQHHILKSLVGHTVKLLDNEEDQTELVKKYNSMLTTIQRAVHDNYGTPGLLSAAATAYRQSSGGQV